MACLDISLHVLRPVRPQVVEGDSSFSTIDAMVTVVVRFFNNRLSSDNQRESELLPVLRPVIVKRIRMNEISVFIIDFFVVYSTSMVYFLSKYYIFPDWTQKYRIEIHCTELIVFQIFSILETILVNWFLKFQIHFLSLKYF